MAAYLLTEPSSICANPPDTAGAHHEHERPGAALR